MNYKRPGAIRAGFHYQDLVAIEKLIEFYRNPSRYDWMELESLDPSFSAVDDVVAMRSDGTVDVIQIKFAVDPDNPKTPLDWDWLLKRKKSGSSMLKKWFSSVQELISSATLASARLVTDRLPDKQFSDCLSLG